ncbi:MAG: tetratricopeptide repeat protein [Hyphomicrobiales bacterium]
MLISDLMIGDQVAPDTVIRDIETSDVAYVPVENPMKAGREQFASRNYGLAEKHFRLVTEQRPDNVDAWIALGATYDHLRRFDLSKRAYHKAVALVGPSPEILNNMGYSLLLQGRLVEARKRLFAALQMEPNNPHIQANIELLREGVVRAQRQRAS